MHSNALTFLKRSLLPLGWAALTLGALLFFDPRPVLFESLESKTIELGPVFNEITYKPGLTKDLWMMRQSHSGLVNPPHQWDRIAISIDHRKGEAEFFQLKPGSNHLENGLIKMDYRVSCFMCHSNGPRAIRPNFDSGSANISLWDRMRIVAWNLRVKTYGRVQSVSKGTEMAPFRRSEEVLNRTLQVKTCMKCHKEDGILSRGPLMTQNFMAIRFMVENKFMPPLGFRLSDSEKEEIQRFIRGKI